MPFVARVLGKSNLGEKTEIKSGKISIGIHPRYLFLSKMDLSSVKGSISAWKEMFHFALFTRKAEGMKMWIPRSDPLMSSSLSLPASCTKDSTVFPLPALSSYFGEEDKVMQE